MTVLGRFKNAQGEAFGAKPCGVAPERVLGPPWDMMMSWANPLNLVAAMSVSFAIANHIHASGQVRSGGYMSTIQKRHGKLGVFRKESILSRHASERGRSTNTLVLLHAERVTHCCQTSRRPRI